MESIIQFISWNKILELFQSANYRIVLIMPAIHEEWIEALISLNTNPDLEIWICVDNQEEVYRSGYGNIKSIKLLVDRGAFIKQCANLRLGFIGIDDAGWSIFIESRIFSGNPDGPNAILLETNAVNNILESFFPEKFNNLFDLADSPDVVQLNTQDLAGIEKKLADNPPVAPDLQREISVYNTLFQYAELHFEGGNVSSKTLTINPSDLPFRDAALKKRMKTRFSLFTKEETDTWSALSEIKEKIDEIRNNYLTPCSLRKDKSILKKENKIAFQKAVKDLQVLVEKNMKELQNDIQTSINNSADTLKNEIGNFLKANPPDSTEGLDGPNKDRQIEWEINRMHSRLNIPSARELINKVRLQVYYYELTSEDLSDKEFIDWFKYAKLISKESENQLATYRPAFEIKK